MYTHRYVYIYIYIYLTTYIYAYIYIYIYICANGSVKSGISLCPRWGSRWLV